MNRLWIALAATVTIAGCASAASAGDLPPAAPDYALGESWVCRPGRQDACAIDLSAETVGPRGARTLPAPRRPEPKIDCFYLYPTISEAPSINAPITFTEAEARVVRLQLAQLGSVCRLYVPLYRQLTLEDMKRRAAGQPTPAGAAPLTEADAAAAWTYYLEHDNQGRGFVLIGHSQGSVLLEPLIAGSIDGKPLQARLVSAILPGSFVLAPTGADVGGTFKAIPACRAAGQIGCVVVFNSFHLPGPPVGFPSRFGDQQALCTNPAALAGGRGRLEPLLATNGEMIIPPFGVQGPMWKALGAKAGTPYFRPETPLYAECRDDDRGIYLAVFEGDGDAWSLGGGWVQDGVPQPDMGLHLIDLELTMGNLIDVVAAQAAAYEAGGRAATP
ncbi:MAG: DUF3089 domain-containing protein [Caulobacter sp.]|nr:DUF3089 domain-containing protein [Caulobacter sp.]